MAETLAHHRYYGIPAEDAMPRTFVALEVKLQAALDLRNGKVRQRLRISGKHLLTIDWRSEANTGGEPLTQRIGRAIHVEGWEGLVVPSAADPQGHNLVLFPDNLMPDSKLDIRNVERLEAR
jgi:RES domain-containing protein